MTLLTFLHYNRPNLQDLIQLLHSMAALLETQIPLPEVLTECIAQTTNKQLRASLERINLLVTAGEPLSNALAGESIFPQLIPALVRTSETTGTLHLAIEHAVSILELQNKGRQNLISSLSYPAIIMTVTLMSALFLATVIAPQTASMYQQMGYELPLLTQIVIYGGYSAFAAMILMTCFFIISSFTRKNTGSIILQSFKRIAVIRSIMETQSTALWTRCLGILLSHGIQLPDALGMTAEGAAGKLTQDELLSVRKLIISGKSPADAFIEMKTIPALAGRILQAGDRAGNLANACDRVFNLMESEYQNRIQRMLSLAEPTAILIAGSFVILVALAVMLPIADLGGIL